MTQVSPEGPGMRQIIRGPKDITSGCLHLLGMLLSVAGMVVLLDRTVSGGRDPWQLLSFSVYGASMILLYAASSLYHFLYISEKAHQAFRRMDHIMIFLLIAGTYTPICLVSLGGRIGWTLFGVVWGLAALGILMKIFWMNAPRWLYTLYYILMGWAAIVPIGHLRESMKPGGVAWLLAGGLFYTVGGVFYAIKWPRINRTRFGFHELFHVFILAGSLCHYLMMLCYVVPA